MGGIACSAFHPAAIEYASIHGPETTNGHPPCLRMALKLFKPRPLSFSALVCTWRMSLVTFQVLFQFIPCPHPAKNCKSRKALRRTQIKDKYKIKK